MKWEKEKSDRHDCRQDNEYYHHKGHAIYTYWCAWRRILKYGKAKQLRIKRETFL